MYRSRLAKPISFSLLLITCIYAVSAACGEPFVEPCETRTGHDADKLLDKGTWRVVTINGQPADGWALPLPSFDYFYRGVIDFTTTTLDGSCGEPIKSSGTATAQYALRNSSGDLKPNKNFVGRFSFDHKTNKLTLTAAGYVVNGSVNGNVMTLPAAHKLFGSAVVVLQRDN
jgi:hypothetical protein